MCSPQHTSLIWHTQLEAKLQKKITLARSLSGSSSLLFSGPFLLLLLSVCIPLINNASSSLWSQGGSRKHCNLIPLCMCVCTQGLTMWKNTVLYNALYLPHTLKHHFGCSLKVYQRVQSRTLQWIEWREDALSWLRFIDISNYTQFVKKNISDGIICILSLVNA